jgi:hypothetical protein
MMTIWRPVRREGRAVFFAELGGFGLLGGEAL